MRTYRWIACETCGAVDTMSFRSASGLPESPTKTSLGSPASAFRVPLLSSRTCSGATAGAETVSLMGAEPVISRSRQVGRRRVRRPFPLSGTPPGHGEDMIVHAAAIVTKPVVTQRRAYGRHFRTGLCRRKCRPAGRTGGSRHFRSASAGRECRPGRDLSTQCLRRRRERAPGPAHPPVRTAPQNRGVERRPRNLLRHAPCPQIRTGQQRKDSGHNGKNVLNGHFFEVHS